MIMENIVEELDGGEMGGMIAAVQVHHQVQRCDGTLDLTDVTSSMTFQ